MPPVPDETLDDLAELDGWSVHGLVATYRPLDAGWRAMLHNRVVYGKAHNRWHVAITEPADPRRGRRETCIDVTLRSRLTDARQYAERRVRHANRPKLAA